jgi:hypothetical protein
VETAEASLQERRDGQVRAVGVVVIARRRNQLRESIDTAPAPRARRPIAQAAAAMFAAAVLAGANSIRADEEWHVVERHSTTQPPAGAATAEAPAGAATAVVPLACGELARPAGEPYKTIVAQLNGMWETNFPVYESLKPLSPHASSRGCIFYNRPYLDFVLQRWMRIDDPAAVAPMLYAIFAHELGHLAHGDFDPAQRQVPLKNKELAADQFAGYSLERMGIRRLDSAEVTRYYQLTGDDFGGIASGHGNGAERTTAFQNGWHRAEVGLPEQGARPAGGLGQP